MRPTREQIRKEQAAYFVSTQTARRQPFFRHERWAKLCEATILHYAGTAYSLHAYVIMPDHLHLLLTPIESLEKAVQLIKGGFSFRVKKELGWNSDVWQPGFTDHRTRDEQDWDRHLEYIRRNPIKRKLVQPYPFIGFPDSLFPQQLNPNHTLEDQNGPAAARHLHVEV
jgi:putative transposase